MPHVPDLNHQTHDLELVAAHAAGDTAGTRLATADARLASCASCAELHADLRAISAALPSVPARPRTRDYRLTAAHARALQPRGWRRMVAAFGAPRLAFAAPVGSGLAALGIAGLLVAAVPGAPAPFLASENAARIAVLENATPQFTTWDGHGAASAPPGAPSSAPAMGGEVASPPSDAGGGSGGVQASGGPDTLGEKGAVREESADFAAAVEAERVRQADETLVLLGGMTLLAGVGLLGLRWAARRPI